MSNLTQRLRSIGDTFQTNTASVRSLMQFDEVVLQFAIRQLENLQERLTRVHQIDNARLDVSQALEVLRKIRINDSLSIQYKQVLNQCNVLLVSYFSSAISDVFKASIAEAVRDGGDETLLKQEIKISLREVREIGSELLERSGELLAAHRDFSFQDMQSISKAFREYFSISIPQDEMVNDLICSQACRHAIVHCGAIVDRKMVGQLRNAHPRTLKPKISEGDRIQLSESEIGLVGDRMKMFFDSLTGQLAK